MGQQECCANRLTTAEPLADGRLDIDSTGPQHLRHVTVGSAVRTVLCFVDIRHSDCLQINLAAWKTTKVSPSIYLEIG